MKPGECNAQTSHNIFKREKMVSDGTAMSSGKQMEIFPISFHDMTFCILLELHRVNFENKIMKS